MPNRRKPTVARGAVIERSLIKRWIGRTAAQVNTQPKSPRTRGYCEALADLLDWLRLQPGRTNRPGGIGRSRAPKRLRS